MKKYIHNLIKRACPGSDPEAGFTLLEMIVAAAAFTIICAGLTTLLITSLRIQRYTADNTNYRETVRMVRAFVKDQAADGEIVVASDGSELKLNDVSILKYEEHALQVGGNADPLVKGLKNDVHFEPTGHLLRFTLAFDGDGDTNEFPITIYCPRGIEEEPAA